MAFPITSGGAAVLSMVQSGAAFNMSILGSITSCGSGLASSAAAFAGVSAVAAGLDLTALMAFPSQLTTIAAPGGALETMTTHVTSQFTNLADNAGLYAGQLNLATGLQSVGSSLTSLSGIDLTGNPCAGLSTFFGSITGVGAGLLQTITGGVEMITATITALIQMGEQLIAEGEQLVQSAIDSAVSAIASAIAPVLTAAASILTMVASEISALANALADLLNFSISSAINLLFNNPCGKMLLNAVGTTGLLSALSSI